MGLLTIPVVSEGMVLFKKIYWVWNIVLAIMLVYSYKNIRVVYLMYILVHIRSFWPILDMENRSPYYTDG